VPLLVTEQVFLSFVKVMVPLCISDRQRQRNNAFVYFFVRGTEENQWIGTSKGQYRSVL
jgi:hypothetical protein